MPMITTKDGTQIYYKDWGSGQPVVFSHGWPLSSDAWEDQVIFLGDSGYRCIAHDRGLPPLNLDLSWAEGRGPTTPRSSNSRTLPPLGQRLQHVSPFSLTTSVFNKSGCRTHA